MSIEPIEYRSPATPRARRRRLPLEWLVWPAIACMIASATFAIAAVRKQREAERYRQAFHWDRYLPTPEKYSDFKSWELRWVAWRRAKFAWISAAIAVVLAGVVLTSAAVSEPERPGVRYGRFSVVLMSAGVVLMSLAIGVAIGIFWIVRPVPPPSWGG